VNPEVSVIIQFLNAGELLRDAIKSVLWQTSANWELLLVDGGSSDISAILAAEYSSAYPEQIRHIRSPEGVTLGIFEARLVGANEARGPIVAHLDSDDVWHPYFLERMVGLHREMFRSRPGLVYGPMFYWWPRVTEAGNGYLQPVPRPGLHAPPTLLATFVSDSYSLTPGNSAVVASREIIREAKSVAAVGSRARSTEDQYLWSFVAAHYPICVTADPLVHYRQWGGSTCARTSNDAAIAARAAHLEWLLAYVESLHPTLGRHTVDALVEQIRRAAGADAR